MVFSMTSIFLRLLILFGLIKLISVDFSNWSYSSQFYFNIISTDF